MVSHIAKAALMLSMSHGAQHVDSSRVFAYDPSQLQSWYRANHVDLNAVSETQKAAQGIAVRRHTSAQTQVSISGNFGGVFYVSGVGLGSSQTESNMITVFTNRPLTFSANSFKPLMVGNTSQPGMGSITYSMALFAGTPSHLGALVCGPVSGVDAGFNSQTLTLTSAQVPGDGNLVLVFTRILTVNAGASGAQKLVGTGNISVSIN